MSFCHHRYFPENFRSLGMFVPLPFPSPSHRAVSFCVPADQPNGRRHHCRAGQASGSEDQRAPRMRARPGQQYSRAQFLVDPMGGRWALSSLSTQKAVTMQLAVFVRLRLLVRFLPPVSCPPHSALALCHGRPSESICCDRWPLLRAFALIMTLPRY